MPVVGSKDVEVFNCGWWSIQPADLVLEFTLFAFVCAFKQVKQVKIQWSLYNAADIGSTLCSGLQISC